MRRLIVSFLLSCFFSASLAATPLPADQAFSLSAEQHGGNELALHWHMPSGYHLYKQRIHVKTDKPDATQFESIQWPHTSGEMIAPNGDHLAVYTGNLTLTIPYTSTLSHMRVIVSYQGCASAGFCYPPITKQFMIPREGPYYTTLYPYPYHEKSTPTIKKEKSHPASTASELLNHGSWWALLGGFFIFGLFISLTPCVLPMIPILGSILVNSKGKHLLVKASAYVLGMAVTYALIGAAASFLGANLQAALQLPWVIALTATLFIVFALALFDCFSLSLPSGLTTRLNNWQSNSRFAALRVFLMGALATLVLTPCVTPPLLGALLYIGKSGDIFRGASALFIMGIGMGVPLLIIAIFGQRMLPKAGNWMNHIKTLLGLLMLAVAILTLSRIVSHCVAQYLWISLFVYTSVLLIRGNGLSWIRLPLAILVSIYAGWLGAQTYYFGASSPLPLPTTHHHTHKKLRNQPKQIHSIADLNHALAHVPHDHLVMVQVSADWCLACQIMESKVLPSNTVQQALKGVTQFKVDITHPDDAIKTLMKHYELIAPPVFLFFKNGKEITGSRLVGEQSAKKLTEVLQTLREIQ